MGSSSHFTGLPARLMYALAWTLLVIVALLIPIKNVEHEMSINDFVTTFFSLSIKTWDLVEAIYHIVMFAILTVLWLWALVMRLPRNRSLMISIGIAVVLGIVTEIGQYFVHRSSMMFDMMADFVGVALCVVWLRRLDYYK